MRRILKSQIRGFTDFAAAVAAHADELNSHRIHMKMVEERPDEYVGFPPPQANPLVESAVDEIDGKMVPQFEIVNDDPAPAEVLRAKKNLLLGFLMAQERAAEEAVIPLGYRRHLSIRESDLRKEEQELRNEVLQNFSAQQTQQMQKLINQHAADVGATTSQKKITSLREQHEVAVSDLMATEISEEDVANQVRGKMSDQDARFLEEQADRHRRLDAIRRHGARLQHDVEDLTTETVDSWFEDEQPKLPKPFPT